MSGREQHRHQATLRHAVDVRGLRADGVQDRPYVVDLLLESGKVDRAIRQPQSARIEHDQSRESAKVTQVGRVRWLLPLPLHVREDARDVHQIHWPLADRLIGNVDVAGFGVPGFDVHGGIVALLISPSRAYSTAGARGGVGDGGCPRASRRRSTTPPAMPTMIAPSMPRVAKPQEPTISPEATLATAEVLQIKASDTP